MKKQMDDQRMEMIIGHLLRTGVLLAAGVVLLGAVMYLARNSRFRPVYHDFHGEPSELRTLSGIVHGALKGQKTALIQLGLVLLIATPIVRVVFSAIAFGFERDSLYVVITLIVLAVLLFSLIGH